MSAYPSGDEPFTHVGFYAANSQRCGGVGYVVIGWREDISSHMGQVVGLFPDETKARAYGRKHYPRRYRVAGVERPQP